MSSVLMGIEASLPVSAFGITFGKTIAAGTYTVGVPEGYPDFGNNPQREIQIERDIRFATTPTTNEQLAKVLQAMGSQNTVLTALLPDDRQVVVARGTESQIRALSDSDIRAALGDILKSRSKTVGAVVSAGGSVTFNLNGLASDLALAMVTLEARSPKKFDQGEQPAVCQDWYEAATLAALMGGRLSTEEEWEVAAADLRDVSHENLAEYAHFEAGATALVGGRRANRYGLHDMLGNVWEWQAGLYKSGKVHRGLRGGSWNHFAELVRASDRNYYHPEGRSYGAGFRVVASA